MSTTQIVLQGKDTVIPADVYMSFELSDKKWQLTLSGSVFIDGRHDQTVDTPRAGLDSFPTFVKSNIVSGKLFNTERPPIEVGGFARFAGDWKSTRYATRAGHPPLHNLLDHRGPKEAAWLKLTGWKLVVLTL